VKSIFKHITAAAITFFVCSQGHSSQTDVLTPTSEESFFEIQRPKCRLVRHDAYGDVTRAQAEIQRMQYARTREPVRMEFPNIRDALLQVTNIRYPTIAIHIPRHVEQDNEPAIQQHFNPDLDYSCIVSLAIYSSAGDMRGYWQSAVRSLIPFIQRLPNLMELTLSQQVVEEVIGALRPERYINVDFNSYGSDSIYSTELTQGRADSYLAYLQEVYRNFHFRLVPIFNPIMQFGLEDRESFQGSQVYDDCDDMLS
jgi:hypothetical protein